jgi:hypothetical protein
VPVQEMPGADGAPLGVEVDGASPQPSDDTGVSLRGMVMRGADIGVPGSIALDEEAPASGSSGTAGPGVSRLLLPSSLGFTP